MSETPIWLLDVDGVLNAVCAKPNRAIWDDFQVARILGFNITYSPTVVQRISAWHNAGLVEVQWLTTWEDHANTDLDIGFDVEEFAVAGYSREFPNARWWKLPVAKRAWETGRPIIWTDDDISWDTEASEWVKSIYDTNRMLAISPKTETGLLPVHMATIEGALSLWKSQAQSSSAQPLDQPPTD